ncbi:mannose-1-phosphate guanylyltransferase [Deinococcus yavapaiensis]|uniref:Mannose-1-phosphate guanylyltransferase n=1 Tax=Deinococcus yavapaiensis KR-236 TaxID=694435 RepID=A0A318SD06_9DEIO|nr:mannose-1-phosphate guanylyltransferase [Deinococcus yavapaiensis]PYE49907.1 mannose-1-phosphate guanylyltransferase [Deinococcus yavapaiensis KR-236]
MAQFFPIILAGGKGERLWPASRSSSPKQFLQLLDGQSLLQATAARLTSIADGWDGLWVVTARAWLEDVLQHLPNLPAHHLIIEPEGRDTGPAIAYAVTEAVRQGGEDVILGFFPADHWIGDPSGFERSIRAAVQLAGERDGIVTLGIPPQYPATGYGYIEAGESLAGWEQWDGARVARFTEKPNAETAQEFVDSGRYLWNSGVFVMRAGVALRELRAHAPDIVNPLFERGPQAYAQLPKLSFDYALMEKTREALVIRAAFTWDDLGDWNALERVLGAQQDGNAVMGRHVGIDTHGAIIYSTDARDLIVTLGLEDLVIVRTGHITLISRKDRVQELKSVLAKLRESPDLTEFI